MDYKEMTVDEAASLYSDAKTFDLVGVIKKSSPLLKESISKFGEDYGRRGVYINLVVKDVYSVLANEYMKMRFEKLATELGLENPAENFFTEQE